MVSLPTNPGTLFSQILLMHELLHLEKVYREKILTTNLTPAIEANYL